MVVVRNQAAVRVPVLQAPLAVGRVPRAALPPTARSTARCPARSTYDPIVGSSGNTVAAGRPRRRRDAVVGGVRRASRRAAAVKHLFRNAPMNSCRPRMPKTVKKKTHSRMTLPIMGIARMTVPMSVRMPGSTESVRSGRGTRDGRGAPRRSPRPARATPGTPPPPRSPSRSSRPAGRRLRRAIIEVLRQLPTCAWSRDSCSAVGIGPNGAGKSTLLRTLVGLVGRSGLRAVCTRPRPRSRRSAPLEIRRLRQLPARRRPASTSRWPRRPPESPDFEHGLTRSMRDPRPTTPRSATGRAFDGRLARSEQESASATTRPTGNPSALVATVGSR